MKIVKGQMGYLIVKQESGDADWDYVVATHVFDNEILFRKESGGRYMHVLSDEDDVGGILDNQTTELEFIPLYKNGSPIMSKKNILGKYIFEPKI